MPQPRRTRVTARDPFSTHHSRNSGRRLPHLDKIDPDAPDRLDILLMVNRFELAGVEIDERAIEIATKYLRWKRGNREQKEAELQKELERKRAEAEARDCWVYFIRIGNLVKIGATTNVTSRFTSLRPNEVLAVIPGDFSDEADYHKRFAAMRAGGEYFHPGAALQDYIRELRATHGIPRQTKSEVPDGQNWFPKES